MNKNQSLYPPSTDFSMLDYECSYLPNKMVRMKYKYINEPNMIFTSAVIKRGWRRFGKYYFHPTCNGCNECKSLRIDVENFTITKSQKKAIKRNSQTQIIVGRPSLTKHHLDLYNRYHYYKQDKDGWKYRSISHKEYYENFVDGAEDFGREVLYFQGEKLVCVDLIDILEDGISAIYCYYDPDFDELSLGTFSLLYQIELAKQLGLKWVYLGYWVEGCKAFAYKPKFQPQELLDGFPAIEEKPKWEKA
ncbi:MAG: arginyltransferase [Sulfurovaceae bacterium]|nr:arginyltransferase [Sulfurovaceae bacterium]